jgi:creatinine amidohydrolase/Fe(II)-dependent formamide hydrolase-like protein
VSSEMKASRSPWRKFFLVSLARAVWAGFFPYLVALLVDFLISISQWACVYVFQRLTEALAVKGIEGAIIIAVHSGNTALAFSTFGVLFTYDVIQIRRGVHYRPFQRSRRIPH